MAKHEKNYVDFDKQYENNLIGLKGIIYFAGGLFLLVVVTFGLMWFLENIMEEQSVASKDQMNPMTMKGEERLPPEPRLQAAPGFGVESPKGYVNLELKAPQSEYRELHQQWEKVWAEGQKDPKTGTVISLPIDEAKNKLMQQNAQVVKDESRQNELEKSRALVSLSSAGRLASDVRR